MKHPAILAVAVAAMCIVTAAAGTFASSAGADPINAPSSGSITVVCGAHGLAFPSRARTYAREGAVVTATGQAVK